LDLAARRQGLQADLQLATNRRTRSSPEYVAELDGTACIGELAGEAERNRLGRSTGCDRTRAAHIGIRDLESDRRSRTVGKAQRALGGDVKRAGNQLAIHGHLAIERPARRHVEPPGALVDRKQGVEAKQLDESAAISSLEMRGQLRVADRQL